MKRLLRSGGLYFILFLLLLFLAFNYFGPRKQPKSFDLNFFIKKVEAGEVKEATIFDRDNIIKGKLEDGTSFEATFPEDYNISALLLKYKVKTAVNPQKEAVWWMVLSQFLPFVLILAFWIFMVQQMQGGGSRVMAFGKSRAKKVTKDQSKVTFKDIAGLDEAVEELGEIRDFLSSPNKFISLGAKIPKGVLLYGPPGAGKTLLARAVAGEAGVPFFSISGSDFVEMFVGVGASRVRDLFDQAKAHAPCLPGETIVTLSSGKEVTIEEMFNQKMVGVFVPSMREDLKTEEAKVIGITRREYNQLYEIKTQHTAIKATNNHLLPVLREGKLEWVRADELREGERIAAPRLIKTAPLLKKTLELLPANTRLYLKSFNNATRKRPKSIKIKEATFFDHQDIEKIALGRGGWTDSVLSKFPEYLNEDLLYLSGLIASDGYYSSRSQSAVQFINTEKNLHKKVAEVLKNNFGYEVQFRQNKKDYNLLLPQGNSPKKLKDCYTTYINNKLIKIILQNLEKELFELPPNLIASWLRGVFDGDGYVSKTPNFPKIVISATARDINKLIRACLHRIGIFPYNAGGRNIEITGKENIQIFREKVGSDHKKKLPRLKDLDLKGEVATRLDGIPAGNLLKEARLSLGMGQRAFKKGHYISQYERNLVTPTRQMLQNIVREMEEWAIKQGKKVTPQLVQLKRLAEGEIIWTKITGLKELGKEEYVYDLCLNDHHNFVANGLFVHNCIVFVDEIDAVGRHRGAGLGGGHDEREQTLNQLLVEMDGFDIKDNVIIVAATNRPDILDPALLRPGRFDRQVVVDRPDLRGRVAILKVHSRGKPLAKDVKLEVLARRTPGFTGADLANLVNEAALLTARHGKKAIDMPELEEAIDRVMAGPERKSRLISDREKEVIAHHEGGHALVAHILPHTDPVHKISIIPRGRTLGYTLTLPTEDRYLVAKSELTDELAMLLGGRVAEEMVFSDVTTGDHDDLERATKIARQMVCEYGMSDKLGPLTWGQKQHEVFLGRDFAANPDYSQEIAFEIDKEVRRIVDQARDKAKTILTKNRRKLDRIAKALIERETLEKEELLALLEGQEIPKKPLEEGTPEEALEEVKEAAPESKKRRKVPGKLRPAEG